MSYEIEQKFRTGPDGHAGVARRLAEMGAVAGETVEQEDTYLNHPSRDFRETGEAFRVRRVGSHNAITYKGPRFAGPTKTRREFEVDFREGPEASERLKLVFESLGFRPVASVRKVRTPYHLEVNGRAVEVVLDVAEGVGTFVEVETIAAEEGDAADAQAAVLGVAARLGLTEVEPRSYLRMLLERREAGAGENSPSQE